MARGTGDSVLSWGRAAGLSGELRVPLQWPGLALKMLVNPEEAAWAAAIIGLAAEDEVTMELLAKVAVVWELKAWWSKKLRLLLCSPVELVGCFSLTWL